MLRLVILSGIVACILHPVKSYSQADSIPNKTYLKNLSLEDLMNIEVTSVSKRPEKLMGAASAIQVITQREISRSGALSLPQALRLADNLDVAKENSHDWAISSRGFNANLANKLLVLIDGRAVYTPLYGGVLWNVQDYLLEDIDRIEVISGPGGTLWGANAVNGVINIISKSAKNSQGFYYTEALGGQVQPFNRGIRYGGTIAPNAYFRVYGKYSDFGTEYITDNDSTSDSWHTGRGGFRVDIESVGNGSLTFQGDVYGGKLNQPNAAREETSGGNVLGRWSHTFSDFSDMTLQVYYDRVHLRYPYIDPLGTLTDDLDTYDLDFHHNIQIGDRNKVVWGLGYRFTHEVEHNATQVLFLPPKLDHSLFNVFVQDEIKLLEDLRLTVGSKLEHFDYTGFEVEPSARLQWQVIQDHMIWGAVSRAVRTPSRYDRDLVIPTFLPPPYDIFIKGGDDFISETLIAYEFGYRGQLGRRASFSASLFRNDYDNLRSQTPGPEVNFFLPYVFENNLEGTTYGAELSLEYNVSTWWQAHLGYDMIGEDIKVKAGKVDNGNALNETADPKSRFTFGSNFDLPENFELNAQLRWTDKRPINDNGTQVMVPSYYELTARLGWKITRNIEFAVVGRNLLHDHHLEYGVPGPGSIQIKRSVYGRLTFRF